MRTSLTVTALLKLNPVREADNKHLHLETQGSLSEEFKKTERKKNIDDNILLVNKGMLYMHSKKSAVQNLHPLE